MKIPYDDDLHDEDIDLCEEDFKYARRHGTKQRPSPPKDKEWYKDNKKTNKPRRGGKQDVWDSN